MARWTVPIGRPQLQTSATFTAIRLLRWGIAQFPDGDAPLIDNALTEGEEPLYLIAVSVARNLSNRVEASITIGPNPNAAGGIGHDLSSLFETQGWFTLTTGALSITIRGRNDLQEPYQWQHDDIDNESEVLAYVLAVFALPEVERDTTITIDDGEEPPTPDPPPRPVNTTLQAEARKTANQPIVQAQFANHAIDVPFLDWQEIYEESTIEPVHDAVVAGDGGIVMIRLNGSQVQTRRIQHPHAGETAWPTSAAPWSTRRTSSAVQSTNRPAIASAYNPTFSILPADVAAAGRNKRVQICWLESNGQYIRGMHSTDYGATWSGLYTIARPSSGYRFVQVAADFSTAISGRSMNPRVFFAETRSNVSRIGYVFVTGVDNYSQSWSGKQIWSKLTETEIGSMTVANGPDPDTPSDEVSFVLSVRERDGITQDVVHCTTVGGTPSVPDWRGERVAFVGDFRHYNEIRVMGPFYFHNVPYNTVQRYFITMNRIKDEFKSHNASLMAFTPNPNIISEWTPLLEFHDTGIAPLYRQADGSFYLVAGNTAHNAQGYQDVRIGDTHTVTNSDALLAMDISMEENAPSHGELVLDNTATSYTPETLPNALKAGRQVVIRTGYRIGDRPIEQMTVAQSTWYVQKVRFTEDTRTGNKWLHFNIGDPAAFIDSLWQPIHHDIFFRDTLIEGVLREQLFIPPVPQLPDILGFLGISLGGAGGAGAGAGAGAGGGAAPPDTSWTRRLQPGIAGINAPYTPQVPIPLPPIPGINTPYPDITPQLPQIPGINSPYPDPPAFPPRRYNELFGTEQVPEYLRGSWPYRQPGPFVPPGYGRR